MNAPINRPDLMTPPALLATDPELALQSALWFWDVRKLNSLSDNDDLRAVTKRINGGYNGLDDRLAYLGRAKAVL